MNRKQRRKELHERQMREQKGREELGRAPILVHTIFGASILGHDSPIYVRLGDQYVRKAANELKRGEDVLFAKEGAGITLEQAEAALVKSPRYAAAAPVLFKRMEDGTFTTSFNYHLREGIHANRSAWPDSLAGMDMKAALALDAHDEKARDAAIAIHETLAKGAVNVTVGHIRYRWLGGQVLAPREMDAAFGLLLPLSGGMANLMSDEFRQAYSTYTKIRRAVMHSVSLVLKGRDPDSERAVETPDRRGEKMSVRPEIRLVAQHFVNDVSMNYASASVLSVSALEPSGKGMPEGGVLFRGIVSADAASLGIRLKDPAKFAREICEMTAIFSRIHYEFLMRERPQLFAGSGILGGPMEIFRAAPQSLFKELVFRKLGMEDKMDRILEEIISDLAKTGNALVASRVSAAIEKIKRPVAELDEASDLFIKQMFSGELDDAYGYDRGFLHSALDYHLKQSLAIPDESSEVMALNMVRGVKFTVSTLLQKQIPTAREDVRISELKARLREKNFAGKVKQSAFAFLLANPALTTVSTHPLLSGRNSPDELLAQIDAAHKAYHRLNVRHDCSGLDLGSLIDGDESSIAVLEEIGFGRLASLFIKAGEKAKPYFGQHPEPARHLPEKIAIATTTGNVYFTPPGSGGYPGTKFTI